MLGLSATPERKDNMTKVIKWHIGDIIPLNLVKYNVNIDIKRFILNNENTLSKFNKKLVFSNIITELLKNDVRNNIIVKIIIDELLQCEDRHFLLLSDRIEHLHSLKNIFIQKNINSVSLFIGGMSKEELLKSSKSKIILATYPMANEGLDIVSLNCLVLASPKVDVFQSIGRISRLKENNKLIKPLIIDIIDVSKIFINEADKRLLLYKKKNYEIIDYVYTKNNIFEINKSAEIQENKHINKNDLFVDNFFDSFYSCN
jgi:superfamily II DNA or RNA helicase